MNNKNQYTDSKSLSKTMLLGALIAALAVFSMTMIAASKIFTESLSKQTERSAETLITLSFNNMYQIMSKGWNRDELLTFLAEMEQTYSEHDLRFSIYRSDIVNGQFGELDSKINPDVQPLYDEVLQTKAPLTIETPNGIQTLKPLIAKQVCLQCHTQAKVGDILGIMGVQQPISQMVATARNEFILLMLVLMPIPLLFAAWVGRRFSKSVIKSIMVLDEHISSIHQVDDLAKLTHEDAVFKYREFQVLNKSLKQLGDKLKHIAIDRDILDFEIQLLDKLVLSSELIKDWKQHICILMNEINYILPLYTMFVVFRTDDIEQYVIEIFWLGVPSQKIQKEMEAHAKVLLSANSIFDTGSVFKVNHTYTTNDPLEVQTRIKTQSKSLLLETPKIGGVVGLGVEMFPPKESSRSVVVESVLTTLVNVIGSIKAINKFTKELEYYATRDPLTHLYNQRVFTEMLSYEVVRAKSHGYHFGLLMIDFDNFKLINDQYGHAFGDEVLQNFAQVIKTVLNEGDIFARYGGDEFCVILPERDLDAAIEVAEKLLEATQGLKLLSPKADTVSIACSVGISVYPDHADNKEDLFMVADNMLYRVKDSGKNALSYPQEGDLVQAYKEFNDQSVFILHSLETGEPIEPNYQPIVNTRNGKIEIHELLMRLRQEGQLISAGRFIETAEHMGLVNQMDLILIDKALANIHETGYDGLLFINLSPKAIVASEFIKKIQTLTLKYDINPQRIVFEITERDTVGSVSLLEKFVIELRSQGFRFAIDDFGSGFSSFQYLKRFPVDYIKIEGEFINNMAKDKIDLAFVESAVNMAKSLNIQTIAEFIENEETLTLVKELGIDYAQGFFLATPQSEFLTQLKPDVQKVMEASA